MPRGDAVAVRGEMSMVRTDGRNRRAAETRRKIIEAAKAMIAETSVAPTVVGVAKRADVSVRSVFQHFGDVESLFVTVMDSVRDDLVVPPPTPSANRPLVGPHRHRSWRALPRFSTRSCPLRVAAGQFVDHPALIERGADVAQGVARGHLRGVRARIRRAERAGPRAAGRCHRRGPVAGRLDRAAPPRRPRASSGPRRCGASP